MRGRVKSARGGSSSACMDSRKQEAPHFRCLEGGGMGKGVDSERWGGEQSSSSRSASPGGIHIHAISSTDSFLSMTLASKPLMRLLRPEQEGVRLGERGGGVALALSATFFLLCEFEAAAPARHVPLRNQGRCPIARHHAPAHAGVSDLFGPAVYN
jgi:hypothetical protein